MDIAILVAFFTLIGVAVGYYYGFKFAQERMITELTDMVLENIADLTHEIVEDQHYLYYKDTGEFAAQGGSLDDAAKNFGIRDKSVGRFITNLGKPMFIVDGKIETE